MIWVVLASILGGTLLLAGIPKLRDRDGLLTVVKGYRLLPAPAERAVAAPLPFVEVVVGALLILGIGGRWPAVAAALLFTAFTTGLTVNLARGRRDLDCGCFAFGAHEVPQIDDSVRELVRDMTETMYAKNGAGLAAIQVGSPLRLFIVEPTVGGRGENDPPEVVDATRNRHATSTRCSGWGRRSQADEKPRVHASPHWDYTRQEGSSSWRLLRDS